MVFYSTQSEEFWQELDTDGIVRSLTAKAHAAREGSWKQKTSIESPASQPMTFVTTAEVTERAYSIMKDLFRDRHPGEQFEELIWGYSVSNPLPGQEERTFDVPDDAPTIAFPKYWWNEVFQLVRVEVNQGHPFGHYISTICNAYGLPRCATYHDLLRALATLDTAKLCEPSQQHMYFHNGQPIMEIVVPYLKREWIVTRGRDPGSQDGVDFKGHIMTRKGPSLVPEAVSTPHPR